MTRDEALKEAEGKSWVFRSCWECNGAHEHLKRADYVVVCVFCGCVWWKGVLLRRDERSLQEVRVADYVDVRINLSPVEER